MSLCVNVWWLFGLLRASCSYPEPGYIVVKALFFRIFDTTPSDEEERDKKKDKKRNGIKKTDKAQKIEKEKKRDKNASKKQDASAETGARPEAAQEEAAGAGEQGALSKLKKIRYTISGLCDKIKEIWENISYYMELLQEEDTKLLFSHALLRSGKILKNIRPRRIKARILFGFDTPDATGYVYGIYCMLASYLGSGVSVVPDFENKVFQAEVLIEGRVTLWVALINGLKLLFDKKLKKFMNKMRKEKKEVS